MKQKQFNNQNVIVIGATGGLGTAFAHAFADAGARLILAGRNTDKLAQLSKTFAPETLTHSIDTTDVSSIDALAQFAQTVWGHVDVVVNVAGIDVRKAFDEHSIGEIRNAVDLDLVAPILITRAFLPMLRQQSSGTLVHIGGFGDGRLALPYFTVDVASRAGLATFTEAINRELDGTGINVMFFSPPPADTETERQFHPLWKKMDLAIAPASQVAIELLDAISKRKRVHIMGGALTVIFSKLNAAFPGLADVVMMNQYRKILRDFFTPTTTSLSSSIERQKSWGR
jgi:short-subunit dehydrogenase